MYATIKRPLKASCPRGHGPSFMRGRTVSHYNIIEKIGSGNMGVVFKAQDLRLGRLVALKFLSPGLSFEAEAKERFAHEATAASALDHPNICTIHEISESELGQVFIAMAYYDGETLEEKLKRGSLPLAEVRDLAIQTASGLAKLHSEGIVHLDIKPANLLITNEGKVKIIDFGLAKLGGSRTAAGGTIAGTPLYMSPEQIVGREIDHRTEIWSLGVVLYEMIAGKLPFEESRFEAIVYAVLNEEFRPMKHFRDKLPDHLEKVVRKALAKNADERYQQADELIADLVAARGIPHGPMAAAKPPSGAKPAKCALQHRPNARQA